MKYILIALIIVVGFIAYSITASVNSLHQLNASVKISDEEIKNDLAPALESMMKESNAQPSQLAVAGNTEAPAQKKESVETELNSIQDIDRKLASLSSQRESYEMRYSILQVLEGDGFSKTDQFEVASRELQNTIAENHNIDDNPDVYRFVTGTHAIAVQSSANQATAMQLTLDALKQTSENDTDTRRVIRTQLLNTFPEVEVEFDKKCDAYGIKTKVSANFADK